jgi:hypothetical protein
MFLPQAQVCLLVVCLLDITDQNLCGRWLNLLKLNLGLPHHGMDLRGRRLQEIFEQIFEVAEAAGRQTGDRKKKRR